MIVLDASALVAILLNTTAGRTAFAYVADPGVGVHAPHLADLEIVQMLRRYVRQKLLKPSEATGALQELRRLDLRRHAHEPLLDRVWALRDNFSAYDAVYIALAMALDAPLMTCDARLARAPKPAGLRVVLVQ